MAVTPVQSEHVTTRTVLYFTRMRHHLSFSFGNITKTIMAEEAVVLVSRPRQPLAILPHEEMEWVRALVPQGDMPLGLATQEVERATTLFRDSEAEVNALAEARAAQLLEDHQRVRSAAHVEAGSVRVEACHPVDVIAVSVLLPAV